VKFAVAATAAALLIACSGDNTANNASGNASRAPASAPSADIERMVTLAPHLAELVFASGAGDLLVGVSAYSDYPEAAGDLPVLSDAFTVDQERLALLRPDLLLAWQSGTPANVIDELRAAGFRVEAIATRGINDVAAALRRIGELSNRSTQANAAAAEFLASMAELQSEYADAVPITVFYQVSERPLYTINGEHFIGELLALCGGQNVFAELSQLAPSVSVEAVIDRDPEVLMSADDGSGSPFAEWQRWESLAANRFGNHFSIDAAEVARATPRLIQAGEKVCGALDQARVNRDQQGG
jgi:iron complex transport system substrate-binding protein